MAYQITIAGKTETSHPELLVVGNRIRARVFASALMAEYNGSDTVIDAIGTVIETEQDDDDYIEVVMRTDDGKRKSFACKLTGAHNDRLVEAA